jgi:hypothetical protein
MPDVALTNRTYNETIKRADQFCKSKEYDEALNLYKKAYALKPDVEYATKQIVKLKRILDLKSKINEKSAAYSYNKAMQLALKTVLNATYGAFANKYFVLSNAKIANAITAMGRDLIRYMIVSTENYFYNKWHTDINRHKLLGLEYIAKGKDGKYYFLNKEYDKVDRPYPFFNNGERGDILLSRQITMDRLTKVEGKIGDFELMYEYKIFDINEIKPLDMNPKWKNEEGVIFYDGKNPISMYGDTDSSHKDTLIHTNNGSFTIENLYNRNIHTGSAGNTLKGHESVNCNDKVLNWEENNKLYYAPVKRIIRHKVTKAKWKLKTKSGKEIIVTNDHSMIVFRGGKKIEIKPCDILKTDKILVIKD